MELSIAHQNIPTALAHEVNKHYSTKICFIELQQYVSINSKQI